MNESVRMSLDLLREHIARYRHISVAWSGGKDSTCVLSFLLWAILTGRVSAPSRLTVIYADTRMEIPPLALAAEGMRRVLEDMVPEFAALGTHLEVRVAVARMEDRYWVYMLGRGVPPPSNRMRWCTPRIKVRPMEEELRAMEEAALGGVAALGSALLCTGSGPAARMLCRAIITPESPSAVLCELGVKHRRVARSLTSPQGASPCEATAKLLVLTGVRFGESAARDARMNLACTKEGAECGQGWFQSSLSGDRSDTLAPMAHWRTCHVWAWLKNWAPKEDGDYAGLDTSLLADAYGGDEAEDAETRMGCICCPLVETDRALEAVLKMPAWSYLAPLRELRELWAWMRLPAQRLRKRGGQRVQSGELAANQQRLGPVKFDRRREALARALDIQARVNAAAELAGRPRIDILSPDEVACIESLLEARTWPDDWTGEEPSGDVMLHRRLNNGNIQYLLPVFQGSDAPPPGGQWEDGEDVDHE